MGRLLVIDVVGAVAVLGIWYFLFAVYNRRKGTEALRWVQSACAGKGRILDSHWLNSSRLDARLQFPSRSFRKRACHHEVPSARHARPLADELLAINKKKR